MRVLFYFKKPSICLEKILALSHLSKLFLTFLAGGGHCTTPKQV